MNPASLILRLAIGLLAGCLAMPAFAQQLDTEDARFFLTRTGFAPHNRDVAIYEKLTRQQAVDKVLAATSSTPLTPVPAWTADAILPRKKQQDLSEEEKKAAREKEQKHIFELRGWWLQEMLNTPSPLTERMTLFWHNHFVSSHQKVPFAQLMYRQNQLLRQSALGNFGTLLHAVSKDPAMLIYLDNAGNRKDAPNENFAREVMELFTLGEGRYGEDDVKQAARAFTGWSIERDTGEFKWRPGIHDTGIKTVLGKSGDFDGDAVLDILLAQPACAEYVVGKLWREFISPEPDPAEVTRIAKRFRDSRYDVKVALHELFLSNAFWDAGNRARLVKSPVEMVIGALNQFEFTYVDPMPFSFAVAQLGQNLFNPPNVKGWPGGDAWINSSTLLARKSILERLFQAIEKGKTAGPASGMMQVAASAAPGADMKQKLGMASQNGGLGKVKGQGALGKEGRIQFANAVSMISFNPDGWLGTFGASASAVPDVTQRLAIQKAVLPLEPSSPIRADLVGTAYLRNLVMDPVYQLK